MKGVLFLPPEMPRTKGVMQSMSKKRGNYHFIPDHVKWYVTDLLAYFLGVFGVLVEPTTWQPARIILH